MLDNPFGEMVAYTHFTPANFITNVIVGQGGVTNVGAISLDSQCPGTPTDVCGNGLDEDANGIADENCPCRGAECSVPLNCADLGMALCNDGTCRVTANECPAAPIPPAPPPPACTAITEQAACDAREDCRSVIGGTDCQRPDGTACVAGDVSCVCSPPFVFQACVAR